MNEKNITSHNIRKILTKLRITLSSLKSHEKENSILYNNMGNKILEMRDLMNNIQKNDCNVEINELKIEFEKLLNDLVLLWSNNKNLI